MLVSKEEDYNYDYDHDYDYENENEKVKEFVSPSGRSLSIYQEFKQSSGTLGKDRTVSSFRLNEVQCFSSYNEHESVCVGL